MGGVLCYTGAMDKTINRNYALALNEEPLVWDLICALYRVADPETEITDDGAIIAPDKIHLEVALAILNLTGNHPQA